ncbi:hypothetical protein [Methylobacterium sp. WSM2598]|uniref:hypothetical protein n=1 Tax=Methylobacterium sp. WSM2598 TaxID=398261 RepID=UPI0003666CE3|nr:hypothetical protein [Methylobacterium sp. WSM2598]
MSSKSIEDWCRSHGLSRSTFYNLKKIGKAPRTFNVGSAVRITDEADRDWCRARENESNAESRAASREAA